MTSKLANGTVNSQELICKEGIAKTAEWAEVVTQCAQDAATVERCDDDVTQQEIETLMHNVPQLSQHFTVLNKIGSGTFSTVFVGRLKNVDAEILFAIKYIIPTSAPSRIVNELQCMKEIGFRENVMGVSSVLRHRDHVVIIMPYAPHDRFPDYVSGGLTVEEVRRYMYELLRALRHVHAHDVIHRDIKPSNFLFDRRRQKYALVDFGLAQKYDPASKRSPKKRKHAECTEGSDRAKSSKLTPNNSPDPSNTEPASTLPTTPESVLGELQNMSNVETDPLIKIALKESKSNTEKTRTSDNSKENKSVSVKDETGSKVIDENAPVSSNMDKSGHLISVSTRDAPAEKTLKPDATSKTDPGGVTLLGPGRSRQPHGKAMCSPRRQVLQKRAREVQQQRMRSAQHSGASSRGKLSNNYVTVVVTKDGKPEYRNIKPSSCVCYGKLQVCSVCLARRSQRAPRAGTPGFRAPEVLLKDEHQTTAVDVWSAGVIFLCMLSWRYPFFKAPDDIHALAQIMCVFGSKPVKKSALQYGKCLTVGKEFPENDLKTLCENLRHAVLITPKMLSKLINNNYVPESTSAKLCPYLKPTDKCKYGTEKGNRKSGLQSSGTKTGNRKLDFQTPEKENRKCDNAPEVVEKVNQNSDEKNQERESFEIKKVLHTLGGWDSLPESAYDLLQKLLDLDPASRVSAEQALKHEFFADIHVEQDLATTDSIEKFSFIK